MEKKTSKPLLIAVYVEGALDDGGPLEAADDKRVGPGSLCLHQLTLCSGGGGGAPNGNTHQK